MPAQGERVTAVGAGLLEKNGSVLREGVAVKYAVSRAHQGEEFSVSCRYPVRGSRSWNISVATNIMSSQAANA